MKKYTLDEIKNERIGVLVRYEKDWKKVAKMFPNEKWNYGDTFKVRNESSKYPFVLIYTKKWNWVYARCIHLSMYDDVFVTSLPKIIIQAELLKEGNKNG